MAQDAASRHESDLNLASDSNGRVQESESVHEARAVVARAQTLFHARNYGAALTEFQHAYTLLAGSPRQNVVLYNIGVCYERLFRYDLALAAYETLQADSTTPQAMQEDLARSAHGLSTLLGRVAVVTNLKADVWVDDHALGNVPRTILVPSGPHAIEVHARGYEMVRREVNVAAGSYQSLQIHLEPVDRYAGLRPDYFWAGTGLTVAAVAVGAALGGSALAEQSAVDRDARLGLRPSARHAQALGLGADVALGAAFVLGISSVVLYFLTDFHEQAKERRPERGAARVHLISSVTSTSFSASVFGALP